MSELGDALRALAEDREAVGAAHLKIEDTLVDFRDNRISVLGRGNGLVIRERDGEDSHVIRMGTDDAMRTALRALADFVDSHAADGLT